MNLTRQEPHDPATDQSKGGWSIRTKLITIVVAAILPCAMVAYLAITEAARRLAIDDGMARALTTTRQAARIAQSLSFDNRREVQTLMAAISLDPLTTAAVLYDTGGHQTASIGERIPPFPTECPPRPMAKLEPGEIGVTAMITDVRRSTGCLVTRRNLRVVEDQFRLVRLSAMLSLPLFLLVVGATLSWLLSRRICEPLARLSKAAGAVSQGQFPAPLEGRENDEIGALSRDFDRMVSRLRSASDEHRELIAKLEQSSSKAGKAAETKSEFLAIMSHEIRTPLNAILGLTDLAIETPPGSEQQEYLKIVKESGALLLQLLNDVLDLSKSEAGKLRLAFSNFHLERCVAAAANTLKACAEKQGIGLSCSVCSEPVFVFGDDQRLRQILINLIGNAVKFTERGEVRVTVTQESNDGALTKLHFAVADTGVGVPSSKQELIFSAFEQADGSTTRRFGGTGLGLAISAELVKKMNGRLWVESPWRDARTGAEVKGSTFHFTAEFCVGQRPELSLPEVPPVPVPPLRILLAEDDPVNQMLMFRLLCKQGHTVTVARDGLETLDALSRASVDLILMDVQMPRMDGLEATSRIREQEKAKGGHVLIVACTALALAGDAQRCRDAGMDDYLSKPVRLDDLNRIIRRWAGAREKCRSVAGDPVLSCPLGTSKAIR